MPGGLQSATTEAAEDTRERNRVRSGKQRSWSKAVKDQGTIYHTCDSESLSSPREGRRLG